MRRLYAIILTALLTAGAFAQAPEKLSYQAIVRDHNGLLVKNSTVGVLVSILQTTPTGTAVYVEKHMAATNINGMITLEIGGGAPITGTFSLIDWSNGPYFLKTETDPLGGTNYTISGTSQLLSVPYALYSKTAESIVGGIIETDPLFAASTAAGITAGDMTNWNSKQNQLIAGQGIAITGNIISSSGFSHYIGELYGGGIVAYVWKESGVEHGLIVSLTDVSPEIPWSNMISTQIGPAAMSPTDGQANTNAIIAQPGHTTSAAKLCDDYTSGGFSDWYLPATNELNLCWNAIFVINTILGTANGFQTTAQQHLYWSSTEFDANNAEEFEFHFGGSYYYDKGNYGVARVRAVRRF